MAVKNVELAVLNDQTKHHMKTRLDEIENRCMEQN